MVKPRCRNINIFSSIYFWQLSNIHLPGATLGPYCTGASIPAENVLRCARPQTQVPLTMRYSMYLTLDLHLDHLASLREHCSCDPGAATSAGADPRQRDDHALVGVIDQGASDAASARLSTGLTPAWLTLRAWWRLLNGESEDGAAGWSCGYPWPGALPTPGYARADAQ